MKTTAIKRQSDYVRMIEQAPLAQATKIKYTKALERYLAAGHKLTSSDDLIAYSHTLPVSTRTHLKSAVRVVTKDTIQGLKSNVSPETLPQTQAALMRLEALNSAIKIKTSKGTKTHAWLSPAQVQALMHTCDDTLTGRRDWVILACLVGAGLRREELTSITCESLRDLPGKNGKPRWVVDVKGKGDKDRTIPIKPIMAERLRDWCKYISQGQVAEPYGLPFGITCPFKGLASLVSVLDALSDIGVCQRQGIIGITDTVLVARPPARFQRG